MRIQPLAMGPVLATTAVLVLADAVSATTQRRSVALLDKAVIISCCHCWCIDIGQQ